MHGLQGDPVRTWSWKGRSSSSSDSAQGPAEGHPQASDPGEATDSLEQAAASEDSSRTESKESVDPLCSKVSHNVKMALNAFSTSKRKRPSPESKTDCSSGLQHRKVLLKEVFWPGDLLPRDCSGARILTWGYDSRITRFHTAPTNKNDIFSHAQDLLCALSAERPLNRPIIFVAHSLGGIIVKDVSTRASINSILRQSSHLIRDDLKLQLIVLSSFVGRKQLKGMKIIRTLLYPPSQ